MSEARYKKINFCLADFKNILEVAVGRSPRDLIFTENQSINYVATDLPESLTTHKMIISKLIKRHKLKRSNLHFFIADALNYDELKKAETLLHTGKIAIISEGFLAYLSFEENKKFLENVYKLLEKNSGILETSDIIIMSEESNK